MSASWWETQDCLAEVSMTKWCPFCLFIFFFCKEENDFFSFLHRQNWSMVSASKRRFALLAQVAPACIPFPIDLTVVQTGFYFYFILFVQSNHAQWNANVQIDISIRAVLTPGQVLGCCWIMGTNIFYKVYSVTRRDFVSSFNKKPLVRIRFVMRLQEKTKGVKNLQVSESADLTD